jgi:GTPase SAR1 family protein
MDENNNNLLNNEESNMMGNGVNQDIKIEKIVLILGLDASGKTTFLNRVVSEKYEVNTIPTIAFNTDF